MTTIAAHQERVRALVEPALGRIDDTEPLTVESLAARPDAALRTIGSRVLAPIDLPPFDNSQMDGFALRTADAGTTVRLAAVVPAGAVPSPLGAGQAAPVMTGAPIPDGADAVVAVESFGVVFPDALALTELTVPTGIAARTFIRARGSDIAAGGVLADHGARTTPALLGSLAAAGVRTVDVRRRPRVLVVSTGSELADSGSPDRASLIGDANGVSLRAALAAVGVESRAVRVPDDPDRFVAEVADAARGWADLVLTTGGISMGAFEVVRQALEPRGLDVGTVAMQPGGPQAVGMVAVDDTRTVPVIGFPGNPVSALVSFEMFLRPVLAAHAGLPADRAAERLPAGEPTTSPIGKHQVRRGTVRGGRVYFVGGPSSHLLAHYADATHLVHVPVGVDAVAPGDPLTVWSIR
ncbi:molybdopterin molybdotransferase MoeA [Curtobacterium sp. RRHDQ10]|uniref:molybdopterin molybdotransferase MoeA n=1 Tax=Curtobacterium phyllosphaerae TaxID=3413379 RepID=UPI003BF2ABDD